MKKRMTVRQKSTVKAAMKPKRLYRVGVILTVHLHDVKECYSYMHRLQTAIAELGATVAAEGIISKMKILEDKSITDGHQFLSISPTDMDGRDVSVIGRG